MPSHEFRLPGPARVAAAAAPAQVVKSEDAHWLRFDAIDNEIVQSAKALLANKPV